MFSAFRSSVRFLWISSIAVLPIFAAIPLFSQSESSPGTPATPAAAQAPASQASQASCPAVPNAEIPYSVTIHAKITGILDSAHLKPGKVIWVTVTDDVDYPGCKLKAGSALYAHVTSAVSGQGANPSELSLSFDHADCQGRNKKEMPLRLIALLGPAKNVLRVHDELPLMMNGPRSIIAVTKTVGTSRDKYNSDGPPLTLQPGAMFGIPRMKLEVDGGPGCSARISSTDRSVHLSWEMEFIFVVEGH